MNLEQSDVTVSQCIFTQNLAELGHGGAVHSYVNASTFIDCEFSDNSAWVDGGGVHDQGGALRLINCEFRGNDAEESGGAVCCNAASTSLMNPAFAG